MLCDVHKRLTNTVNNIGSSTLQEQAGVMRLTNNQSQQNVKFVDGDDPFVHGYHTATDDSRKDQDMEMAPLSEFFSRPIKIGHIFWGTLSAPSGILPWKLFFENPRVANRLTNYNLLRATLKVKFVINGNAFLYGRMLVGYTPLSPNATTNFTTYALTEDAVQLSQVPHVMLNPTTSTGGVITCPFFYNKNCVRIPGNDFADLGRIDWIPLNPIRHANDPAFTPVDISIFAWAEDVQLSVLTSVETTTLLPQSGEIEEANTRGVVSGPATSVARIANALSNIPMIRPYAKATELASSTVANIASRFGYCRPSVTKTPDFVRILPSSSFALTNTPDLSLKLSVDHLQESTVDPRVSGIDEEDMLSIVNIAKRESYLYTFNWQDIAVTGDLLYNIRPTPCTYRLGAADAYHFPATAMAALPFRYWTGTLNYRFQVVCSGFHKGRLAVTWDPNFIASVPVELNTLYSEIIDIAETQDFTISISNGQPFTLIPNFKPGIDAPTSLQSTTKFGIYEEWSNGVIGISVVNALTTPSGDAADVDINVFVSAGDDFKVFVPYDHFQSFICSVPLAGGALAAVVDEPSLILEEQAGDIVTVNDIANDSAPEGQDIHSMYDAKTGAHSNLVFTGESIPSFRSMLKRYSLWTSVAPRIDGGGATGLVSSNIKHAFFPFMRGNVNDAVHLTATGAAYNYSNTLLMHWVTWGFAGWRGNIRYKVLPRFSQSSATFSLAAQRFSFEGLPEYTAPTTYATALYTSQNKAASTAIRQGFFGHDTDYQATGYSGMAWVESGNSSMLEFEVPFYSRYRFAGGRHKSWTAADTFNLGGYYIFSRGQFSNAQLLDFYTAAGEDFQTYFFIGLPRLYYEPLAPAPQL